MDAYFVPAYLGPAGWLGLSFHRLGGADRVDWVEVAELIEMSYRLTAPASLVRELDDRGESPTGQEGCEATTGGGCGGP